MSDLSLILAALYLRGAPRSAEVRRSGWPEVLKVVRRACADRASAADALRNAGMWSEAVILEPRLLDWAERQFEEGAVLTAADHEYPARWIRVLGPSAPPALWKQGEVPPMPSISIVGSRQISTAVSRFCTQAARIAAESGFVIVSGRAEGCDRAAARGAGSALVEILPHGINHARGRVEGCVLSTCPPYEVFSSPAAMERNALIYAASSHTLIGQAQFKEGGTWHGAVHAVRLRLSQLLIRRSEGPGMRALAALGGAWLDAPSDLPAAMRSSSVQRELFDQAV